MEETGVVYRGDEVLDLPPGFRFHPTDEEIITHYLTQKVMDRNFSATAMGEADLNKCEPWDLPQKAKMGDRDQWYFFCQKDRKYPTGSRTNRATESGYWKATGKDKEIFKGKGCLVGMRKTLVFYKGRAPKGMKTNWVMHEFRLEGKFACYHLPKDGKDEWTVCKVCHKNTGIKRTTLPELLRTNSFADDLLDCSSLPPLMDPTYAETNNPGDNVFNGITAVSSAKVSDQGYCLFTNNLVKQENNWNFPVPVNSYIANTSGQANFINPVGNSISMHLHPGVRTTNSSFPYQVSTDDHYRQGFMQAGKKNFVPSVSTGDGFCGSDDDAILRAVAANNNIYHGLDRQFKAEQFSLNQSHVSLSQDTGLSNDINTETSSVISKQDMRNHGTSFDDLDGPSVAPMSDLDCLWNEY